MWAPSTVLQQVAAAVTGRCICLSRSMFTIQGSFQAWSLLIVFVTVNCNNQRVHWPWEFEGQSVHMLCLRQVLKSPVLLQCFSGYDMSAFICMYFSLVFDFLFFFCLFSLLSSFFFLLSSFFFLLPSSSSSSSSSSFFLLPSSSSSLSSSSSSSSFFLSLLLLLLLFLLFLLFLLLLPPLRLPLLPPPPLLLLLLLSSYSFFFLSYLFVLTSSFFRLLSSFFFFFFFWFFLFLASLFSARRTPNKTIFARLVQYGTCKFYCAGGGTWGALNLMDGFAIWWISQNKVRSKWDDLAAYSTLGIFTVQPQEPQTPSSTVDPMQIKPRMR